MNSPWYIITISVGTAITKTKTGKVGLRPGVLGELTRERQAHSGQDISGREGGLLVVTSQARSLAGDSLEDVVHERVHDRHTLLGDTSLGVDLLQHLVDVGGVRLDALGASLTNCGSFSHFKCDCNAVGSTIDN